MSTTTRGGRPARRVEELSANDPQFAAAKPDPAVAEALERPGLRLPQIIATVLKGYAVRPALGQRVVEFVMDPRTGRTSLGLLPRFETITYRELGERVGAIARALASDSVHAGDRVCVLQTYHVMNPYDDGIGMDEFVDWLISPTNGARCPIQRIGDYREWLQRFETSLRGLPEKQRNASLLPLLHNYQKPETPINGSMAPTARFRAAVQDAKVGPDKDIPHISPQIIAKYVSDLRLLGLL
jgi:hypothetical protein